MSVPIQPLADYVVAEPEKAEAKTASGFYVPEGAKKKPKSLKVLAIGKEVTKVKVGDRILVQDGFDKVTEVPHEGVDYVLVEEKHIIATVK